MTNTRFFPISFFLSFSLLAVKQRSNNKKVKRKKNGKAIKRGKNSLLKWRHESCASFDPKREREKNTNSFSRPVPSCPEPSVSVHGLSVCLIANLISFFMSRAKGGHDWPLWRVIWQQLGLDSISRIKRGSSDRTLELPWPLAVLSHH